MEREEFVEQAVQWWKKHLRSKNYVGVIDSCDEFVRYMLFNHNNDIYNNNNE